ncbi:conserved hypothetical protein [Vibrio crassostreae]|uniref:DUF1367 family protein n=1 Tax=Vibrio crassostreae TaxID=246167 RepID=UPI001B3096B3|nr:DUF1367 family protein [Vibrio crassostreae]CAK1923743.1 conserved hypothetical protein [Vibrio crassostreae]CAK2309070.1 conserved hypothetical protein [Vibrio crassostreae]CAK2326679.1 conserved hypothetical protein [Vibrio crassostreae]CAK3241588.1 conserved hypothetical protein [Vibrio crassostreae]
MNTVRSRAKSENLSGEIMQGGFVRFADSEEHEKARKLAGRVVEIKVFKKGRNLRFHRKFFALLNLGFSYWSPSFKGVSDPEENLAHDVAKLFCELAGTPELYEVQGKEIAHLAIQRLESKRLGYLDPEAYKDPDNYRKKVMIEAGFYELEYLPTGGAIKVPWSISFDNMDEIQFEKIYRGCSNVIWNMSLFQTFESKEEMERAVNQMMGFMS